MPKILTSYKKGYKPLPSELIAGQQLAINFTDQIIYGKREDGKVVPLGYLPDANGRASTGVQFNLQFEKPMVSCDTSWEPVNPELNFWLFEQQPDGEVIATSYVPARMLLKVVGGTFDGVDQTEVIAGSEIPAFVDVTGTKSETFQTVIELYDLDNSATVPFLRATVNYMKEAGAGLSQWISTTGPVNYVKTSSGWVSSAKSYITGNFFLEDGSKVYKTWEVTLDTFNGNLTGTLDATKTDDPNNDIIVSETGEGSSSFRMNFVSSDGREIAQTCTSIKDGSDGTGDEGARGASLFAYDIYNTNYSDSTSISKGLAITKYRPTGTLDWLTAYSNMDTVTELMNYILPFQVYKQVRSDQFSFALYKSTSGGQEPVTMGYTMCTTTNTSYNDSQWDFNIKLYVDGSMLVAGTVYSGAIQTGAITAEKLDAGAIDINNKGYVDSGKYVARFSDGGNSGSLTSVLVATAYSGNDCNAARFGNGDTGKGTIYAYNAGSTTANGGKGSPVLQCYTSNGAGSNATIYNTGDIDCHDLSAALVKSGGFEVNNFSKAFVVFSGAGTIKQSKGVTSVNYESVGHYKVDIPNQGNTDYGVLVSTTQNSGTSMGCTRDITTTSFKVICVDHLGTALDPDKITVEIINYNGV
ncbi:MAG: hypothetical protein DRG30_05455 [Epsilonproteobacteria bacterium]|nr:MAG: hypothetical protein DRG30_05455 [Campylobacterota bacterium]